MKNGTPNALISTPIFLVYLVLIVYWPYSLEWTLKFHILFTWKPGILALSTVWKWMHFYFLFLGFTKDSSINLWVLSLTILTWHLTIFLYFLLYWTLGGKNRKLAWTIHLFPNSNQAMGICARVTTIFWSWFLKEWFILS